MKKLLLSIFAVSLSLIGASGQTLDSKVVENGGSGPYKAIVVNDQSIPDFAIYRPENLKEAVAAQGKLPVILFGNGACSKSSWDYQNTLSEIASHGYVIVAVGRMIQPEERAQPKPQTQETVNQAPQSPQGSRGGAPSFIAMHETSPLLEACDLIMKAADESNSDYHNMLDFGKIGATGHSCGGAEALASSVDSRVKTVVMLNAGMGDISMGGASAELVKKLNIPIAYLIGGPEDIAYRNAVMDYERLTQNIPVFMGNYNVGHGGTYGQPHGGVFGKVLLQWFDWQLKGNETQSVFFADDTYREQEYSGWTVQKKNIR